LAGKKFRCPNCQSVLEAPQLDETGTAVLVPAQGGPPAPPPPPKAKTVAIPAPVILAQPVVAAVVETPKTKSTKALSPPEGEDPPVKKKKKKKKSSGGSSSSGTNWGLIAGLGGGLLVLALLVVGGVLFLPKMFSEPELDEKALFDRDPEGLIFIDTEKLFATAPGMQIKEGLVHSPLVMENKFFKAMGIEVTDIKRIYLLIPIVREGVKPEPLFVMTSGKKMNRSQIEAEKSIGTEDVNGRTLYRFAGGGEEQAYLLPGDKTLVMGTRNSLEPITKLKGGTPPGAVSGTIQKGLDSGSQMYFFIKNPEPDAKATNVAMAPFMPMAKFQNAELTGTLADRASFNLVLDYGEKAKANAAITSYKSLPLVLGTLTAPMVRSDPRQKEMVNAFIKFLQDTKPLQNDKLVTLRFELPAEVMGGAISGMIFALQNGPNQFGGGMGPGFPGGGFPLFGAGGGAGGQGGPPTGRPGGGAGASGGQFQGGQPGGARPGGGRGASGGNPGLNSNNGGSPNFPAGAIGGAPGSSGPQAGGSSPPASGGGGGGGLSNIRNGSPGAGVMASRGAGDRAFNQNQLRAIGRAMQLYSDTEGGLPAAAICDPSGKPLLSWRVAILPYLEQDNLYKQFHLNEPWDSPHNKSLLPLMPKQFSPRNQTGESLTPYRVFANGGALDLRSKSPLTSFTDGTSNTFLVVETVDLVEWTQPEVLDPNRIPALGSGGKGQFSAVMADGSVKSLPTTMSQVELKALITKNGGEPVRP